MALKDIWTPLQDAVAGVPNSGSDVSSKPINDIADAVIELEDTKPGKKITDGGEIFNDYDNNIASGVYSHAEGVKTIASGRISHAEGYGTEASGNFCHAEGFKTIASGNFCHAEGCYTKAGSSYQHVQGKYNIVDSSGVYADIVGNGTSDESRSNAYTLDWDGNAWFAGNITIGSDNDVLVSQSDIVNNLDSTDIIKPLSAAQGKVLNDSKADKPAITNSTEATVSTEIADNTELIYGEVTSISVTFPASVGSDYTSNIIFTTPATLPENYTTFPSDVYFKGDECDGGIFIPNASTRYTMLFYYDGTQIIGLVSGIEVTA